MSDDNRPKTPEEAAYPRGKHHEGPSEAAIDAATKLIEWVLAETKYARESAAEGRDANPYHLRGAQFARDLRGLLGLLPPAGHESAAPSIPAEQPLATPGSREPGPTREDDGSREAASGAPEWLGEGWETCPECQGLGETQPVGWQCLSCSGSGRVAVRSASPRDVRAGAGSPQGPAQ